LGCVLPFTVPTHQAQEGLPSRLAVCGFPLKRLLGSWKRLREEGEDLELLQNPAVLFMENGNQVALSPSNFE
jgi:hypothetical protein